MYQNLTILAGFVFVYSAVAGGVERTRISGPMIFTAFGLLIGPVGLGLLSFETDRETLKTLAELTLALHSAHLRPDISLINPFIFS